MKGMNGIVFDGHSARKVQRSIKRYITVFENEGFYRSACKPTRIKKKNHCMKKTIRREALTDMMSNSARGVYKKAMLSCR